MSKHARKHEARPPSVKKEEEKSEDKKFRPDSNDFDFICAGVSNVDGYKRNVLYNLSCLLQTYCTWSTKGEISYGSG